ncbi:putative ferric-chelate reductase 1 isoform X2 [Cyprinodon tularosa]|uniref:putative ferric-chelate reductase 1 isoform X2 n=1 Tax=Cyprinodon tularosa TaxID=77115 RepID=UPI0018E1F068|nr:putative ferric-chelate reductase 1 isoform X2 [Cyprinodon tularosa]
MARGTLSFFFILSFFGGHLVPAAGYANGKVTKACSTMEPHHGVPAQTTTSPYQLKTNVTSFSPGDKIQVILTGSKSFEGFLLQARDPTNQASVSTIGTFMLTNPIRTQLLTCSMHQDSAVSHTSDHKQSKVVVIWNAPHDAPDTVQFFVTVVAHYSKYWLKIPGPIIYQPGVTPLPPLLSTTPNVIPASTPSTLPGPITSEGCGVLKSCLVDPPGCNPGEDLHCFFLSMFKEDSEKQVMTFELSGPAEGYIAFALSLDKWMGNDDVYMCVTDGDSVSVSAAFVSGRTYPEGQTQRGLSSVSWRLADGLIQCRFSRAVRLSHEEPARYDLDQHYYLFLASGHDFGKHKQQPLVSSQRKLINGSAEVLHGSRGPLILKMHGALMLFAWMLTGSVGTFIASFYKHQWANQTLLGQKVWFQVHRGLMMLTVILTAIAFSFPFFYRRGWSKHAGAHPYIGCSVVVLSVLQPVIAVFRPPPDCKRRPIFNVFHWGVGSLTEILAAMQLDEQQIVSSEQLQISSKDSCLKTLLLAALALGNTGLLMALLSTIAEL